MIATGFLSTRLFFNIITNLHIYSFSNVMVVGDQRKYLTCLLTLKVGSSIKSFFYFLKISKQLLPNFNRNRTDLQQLF